MEGKNKDFKASFSFRSHEKKFHKNQTETSKPRKRGKHTCDFCNRSFNHKSCKNDHMRKCQESPEKEATLKKEAVKKCPLCNYNHASKDVIIDHFMHDHNILIESQDLELKNEEFINWKTNVERSTNAKFIVDYTRKSKKYITRSYVCHRSSIYISEGNGRKQNEPSFKINGFCPASFKVNQGSQTCQIHHISTHVGHDTTQLVPLLSEQSVGNKDKKPVTCGECKIPFSKVANLRAHIKRKHPEQLDILCPKKTYAAVVSCSECGKTFVNHSNLRTHMKRAHKDKEQQSRKIHYLKCALCQYCGGKANILGHYVRIHHISMDVEYKEFSSLGDFENWKTNVEGETVASFVSHHGSYSTKNSKKRIFECHRSGQFVSKSTGARQLKTQGSNKINGYCPAHIRVEVVDGHCRLRYHLYKLGIADNSECRLCLEDDEIMEHVVCSWPAGDGFRVAVFGTPKLHLRHLEQQSPERMLRFIKELGLEGKCKVKFCKTHVGHEQELQHLFLTTAQRQEIAAKIAEKIPLSTILEEIKSSATNGKLERLHLLKKKDLYNIERCFQLHTLSTTQENEVDNNLNPNDIEDERTYQVDEVATEEPLNESTDVKQSHDLLERQKAALSAELLNHINSVTTHEELEILKKLIAPIWSNLSLQSYGKEITIEDTHVSIASQDGMGQSMNICQNGSVNIQSVTDTKDLITLQIFDNT